MGLETMIGAIPAKLFGGGDKAPKTPTPAPVPSPDDDSVRAAGDAAAKRAARRRGYLATQLSRPSGGLKTKTGE